MLNDFVLYFLGALHTVVGVDAYWDSLLAVIVLSTVLISACLMAVVALHGFFYLFRIK